MNEDSTVVRFPQPDAFDDPLTAVLRSGARRLLVQAIEAEPRPSWPRWPIGGSPMAGLASSATAMAQNAPSRRGSARSRCGG